jgi:hypothetical protein
MYCQFVRILHFDRQKRGEEGGGWSIRSDNPHFQELVSNGVNLCLPFALTGEQLRNFPPESEAQQGRWAIAAKSCEMSLRFAVFFLILQPVID